MGLNRGHFLEQIRRVNQSCVRQHSQSYLMRLPPPKKIPYMLNSRCRPEQQDTVGRTVRAFQQVPFGLFTAEQHWLVIVVILFLGPARWLSAKGTCLPPSLTPVFHTSDVHSERRDPTPKSCPHPPYMLCLRHRHKLRNINFFKPAVSFYYL